MADLNKHDMEPEAPTSGGGGGDGGGGMSYIKSIRGVLKVNQIGWTFLAFVMSWFCGPSPVNILFAIVVAVGLAVNIGIFIVFFFSMEKRISKMDFYLVDFLVTIVATVAYFALSLPMLITGILNPFCIIAGVFGFLALAAFFVNIWFSFKRWRESSSRAKSNSQPYDTNH